jgi:hypothetical protein
MSGLVAGIGGKIAASLIFGKVKSAATKGVGLLATVPKPVWEAIAVVGYVLALIALHQHYANAALKAADKAGYERRASEDAAALVELVHREQTAETNGKAIAQETRSTNATENLSIHADAGAIRLRGPGAASCGRLNHPAIPAASGGPVAPGDELSDAPGSAVPAGNGQPDLAAVPFDWLVGRAEQADLDRAEVLSWRNWYQLQAAEWAKLKGDKR